MDRSTADYAGMLATIMNALALQDELEKNNIKVRTQSALNLPSVAEPYIRRRAIRHMEKGRLVLFAGGTGNPFMSTDTAAALRSIEINADLLVMAKNGVDGLYDSDPNVNTNAKKIVNITHHDALNKRLEALDSTALTLCMDNSLPIIIFDLFKPDNLMNVLIGKEIGTLINTPKI
jgi:uridylate kinase